MSYQTEIVRGDDQRLRSCFCSNTDAGNLLVGRVVALRAGASTSDNGDGKGFGYAVDYPIGTASVCIGVLHSKNSTRVTYTHGSPALVMSRGVTAHAVWGTSTLETLVQFRPAATFEGLGLSTSTSHIDGALLHGIYGKVLSATVQSEVTHTVQVWVNAQV